jgi:polyisoprenoid-binding protein YceI
MSRIAVGSILLIFILVACATPAESPASPQSVVTESSAAQVVATEAIVLPTNTPETQPVNEAPPATPTNTPESQIEVENSVKIYRLVAGESRVTYEVAETFFNENNRFAIAVGVTTEISGRIEIDLANPQNSQIGPIEVDISRFTSDSGRRDNAIRGRYLESSRYPIAIFTPAQISGLPTSYTEGQSLVFQVTGDLLVRETTRPVTFEVTASLNGDALTGTATTTILMSDFGVGPITILGVLGTEDQVKLAFEFVARQ